MKFYTGVPDVTLARYVDRAFISVNRLRSKNRQSYFQVKDWIMDSGAFSEIKDFGNFRYPVEEYARWINKFSGCGNLELAVSQDYMCEPVMLRITGLNVLEHQLLTIDRYDKLLPLSQIPVMPVLQGFQPEEYVKHLHMYGDRIKLNMRVGVGSVCKRNGNPVAIVAVLEAIKTERPDLKLHGFGLKTTSLNSAYIFNLLYSADSMAWSMAARRQGSNANSGFEAAQFTKKLSVTMGSKPHQMRLEA
jgi:hypothetical protein